MGIRAVRKRCEHTLQGVAVPEPFDLQSFCDVISRRRGRPLELVPKQSRLGPCGVWLALPDRDFVFYEPETTSIHRDHIILHELAHLLCEHQPCEAIDDDVLGQLFPSLDAAVVRRVLGRTSYSAVEEQEAEMTASLVRARIDRAGAVSAPWTGNDGDVLDRLQATFDGRRRPGTDRRAGHA